MHEEPSPSNDRANATPILAAVLKTADADDRIVAVLEYGSRSRGKSDAFSDLDIVLVLRDEDEEPFKIECRSWAAQFGKLLLFIDASGIAQPWAVYDTEPVPTRVDFILTPLSRVTDLSEKLRRPAVDFRTMILYDTTNGLVDAALQAARPEGLQRDERQQMFTRVSGNFWYYALRTWARVEREQWQAVWDDANFVVLRNLQALLRLEAESTDQWYVRDGGINIEREISHDRMRSLMEALPRMPPGELVNSLTLMTRLGGDVCSKIAHRHQWEWPEVLAQRVIGLYERKNEEMGLEQRIDWEDLENRSYYNSHHGDAHAKEVIVDLLGETDLRQAVDWYVEFRPGAEMACAVVRNLNALPAMQRCHEIFLSDAKLVRRQSAVELLSAIGDERSVPFIPEFLRDPDTSIQNCGVHLAENLLLYTNLPDPIRENILSIMRTHKNPYAVEHSHMIDLSRTAEAFEMTADRRVLRKMIPHLVALLKNPTHLSNHDRATAHLAGLIADSSLFISCLEEPLALMRQIPESLVDVKDVRRIDAAIVQHRAKRERFLKAKLVPPGFSYPQQYVEIIRATMLPDLERWRILAEQPLEALWLLEGMQEACPENYPIPFARSTDKHADIACFDGRDMTGNPRVIFYEETNDGIVPSMNRQHDVSNFKEWFGSAKRSQPRRR